MQKSNQGLNTVRFLVPSANPDKFYEVLKLRLATSKKDFYVSGRNKYLKISFHDSGKKVLYTDHNGQKKKYDMFINKSYNSDGLNPIFVYLPTEISVYPLTKKGKLRSMDLELKDMNEKSDFVIKLFWANPNFWATKTDGRLFPDKSDINITRMTAEGRLQDGSEKKFSSPQKSINFGQQTLYFDIQNAEREGFGKEYEHMIIYEPGTNIKVADYVSINNFPINKAEIDRQGCCISKNKNDGSLFISF